MKTADIVTLCASVPLVAAGITYALTTTHPAIHHLAAVMSTCLVYGYTLAACWHVVCVEKRVSEIEKKNRENKRTKWMNVDD